MRVQVISLLCRLVTIYGGVAQLGEHLPCKQGVKSSNLSISICRKQLNESESKTKLEFSARQFTNLNERK